MFYSGATDIRLKFPCERKEGAVIEHEGLEIVWDDCDSELKNFERGHRYFFDQDDKLDADELREISLGQ
jgi:hypothetical protein